MHRRALLSAILATTITGCLDDSETTPQTTEPRFTAPPTTITETPAYFGECADQDLALFDGTAPIRRDNWRSDSATFNHNTHRAIDGGLGTSWSAHTVDDPEWYRVDMRSLQEISKMKLFMDKNIETFHLQVSADDENWKTIKTVEMSKDSPKPTCGDSSDDFLIRAEFVTQSTRYFRILTDEEWSGRWRITELFLYE